MIAALVLALLALVAPAAAQTPRCGFGQGLEALREAGRQVQAGLAADDLLAGRAAAEAAAERLEEATRRFAGCGCPRVAEEARASRGLAEQARFETSLDDLRRPLGRIRFTLEEARRIIDRSGCG
ncbi:hypothetical protein [Paracraurococcus ruber]|uniref:Uncharacterized protein n=1 Tax=Paracraurococcus ruber TaxID=77675 RepID=A0ABS1D272_9PROT|nr:hypothetical protein [Paracraurococcus ruber]MBK1660884.1 hypothetical protein [Paracraurococcus ruber]TDG33830.1 hypothetical protein E2C05_02165 [Paracraurococcus ruber]